MFAYMEVSFWILPGRLGRLRHLLHEHEALEEPMCLCPEQTVPALRQHHCGERPLHLCWKRRERPGALLPGLVPLGHRDAHKPWVKVSSLWILRQAPSDFMIE